MGIPLQRTTFSLYWTVESCCGEWGVLWVHAGRRLGWNRAALRLQPYHYEWTCGRGVVEGVETREDLDHIDTMQSFSFNNLLTHPLNHQLTLMHSPTHSHTNAYTHTLTHTHTHTLTNSHTHTHSRTHTLSHAHICAPPLKP